MQKYKEIRIVFMGTPEFAVASLDALVRSGCNIVAVITAPDKPAGRGMEMQQSAVKKYATENKLPVLQPEKLKDPGFVESLRSLKADLQVVVAFRMLPEVVWNMPPMGSVNLHGSLLPQYRGAAPINWAVINGEKETGVTTFKLKHEIDTGDILLQESFPIAADDNAGDVHDKMKEIGAQLLVKTVKGLADGILKETPQALIGESSIVTGSNSPLTSHHPRELKHAPKIFTDTCKINWNKPVDDVYNLVRGLAPYPAAFTLLKDKKLKIFKAEKINQEHAEPAGKITTDQKTFLRVACNGGFISILELQLEGKKKMDTASFLRGYQIDITSI
ncbi:MAG TPA: methionyl-tRNA formyltransferase [Ferruginibacter sp.]|nr:methionyl-tRNA formyltransferase [Ferruginibacter sp.]